MAKRALASQGFDLAGAARDLEDRARRHVGIYSNPDVSTVVRLIHRNPWAAPAVRAAIEAELAKCPDRAVSLDVPLWPAGTGDRPCA